MMFDLTVQAQAQAQAMNVYVYQKVSLLLVRQNEHAALTNIKDAYIQIHIFTFQETTPREQGTAQC
jgi:hypothetical protein